MQGFIKKNGAINIAFVVIIIVFILVFIQMPIDHLSIKINLILLGIGSIAMLYTGIITAYMFYNAKDSFDKQLGYDKSISTQNLLFKFDESVLVKARKETRTIHNNQKGKEEILSKIEDDDKLKNSVIMLFNYFEHVEIALRMEIVDENIVREALKDTVLDICDKFSLWIDAKGGRTTQESIKRLKDRLNSCSC